MVRFLGAPALALTMMTAAVSSAHAAHRHHHATHLSYRHAAHQAGHSVAHRRYAQVRRAAPAYALATEVADGGYAIEQDPQRIRLVSADVGIAPRYAARQGQQPVRRRYAIREAAADHRFGFARGYGGRPAAWCGWYARQLVGADPGPAYNLARNWAHWGRASRPGIGVMVVWSHHVGMITGQDANGNWIVKSGNVNHSVREQPMSLRGAIAFRAS